MACLRVVFSIQFQDILEKQRIQLYEVFPLTVDAAFL